MQSRSIWVAPDPTGYKVLCHCNELVGVGARCRLRLKPGLKSALAPVPEPCCAEMYENVGSE